MFHPQGPSLVELCVQALSSTRGGYDLLAPKFDFTPFRTPAPVLAPVVPVIQERETRRMLDLCCGTGAVIESAPSAIVHRIGLDFSRGMLQQARQKLCVGANRVPDLGLVQADALQMPFGAVMDVVTCFGALGHFRRGEQERLFRAIWQVLSPGGRLLFPTFRDPSSVELGFWLSHGFNAAMHVRNLVFPREFVMFYLSSCLERVEALLPEIGYSLDVREHLFARPFERMLLISAEKPR